MSEQTLLQMEVDELRHIFDLVWSADMRAVKRWQDAGAAIGEDRSLTLPDRSKLTEWLLNERDSARAKAFEEAAVAAENATLPSHFQWGYDATEQFTFGKKCAAAAIRRLK